MRANQATVVPTVSTFALILHRNGLARPRRRRRQTPPVSARFGAVQTPNALWCVDFTGHFPVGPTRGHPLTVITARGQVSLLRRGESNNQT